MKSWLTDEDRDEIGRRGQDLAARAQVAQDYGIGVNYVGSLASAWRHRNGCVGERNNYDSGHNETEFTAKWSERSKTPFARCPHVIPGIPMSRLMAGR